VGWRFQVSMDGTTWSEPLAEGATQGANAATTISVKPVEAKFIRITQTASPPQNIGWAIQRVRIFAIQ
jgi:F5/8 type C domain